MDHVVCVCQYFRAVEVRIRDVYIWPRDPGDLRLSSLVTAAQAGESWKTILVSILVPQIDPSVPQPVFTITEKAPTRAFSWLKAPTSAFTFKTLC